MLIDENPDWNLLLFIYSSTLFLYVFHRFRGSLNVTGENLTQRIIWAKNHNKTLRIVLIASALFSFYAFLGLNCRQMLLLLPMVFIAGGYTLPLIKKGNERQRFRDIPRLKIFLITVVVSFITVWLPILSDSGFDEFFSKDAMLLLAERALFIFAITVPFDIRDMDFDRKFNLKTIPLLLGEKGAVRLSIIFILCFLALCFVHNYYGNLMESGFLSAMTLSAIFTIIVLSFTKRQRSEYFFSLLVEGTMLVQFLLVLFADLL